MTLELKPYPDFETGREREPYTMQDVASVYSLGEDSSKREHFAIAKLFREERPGTFKTTEYMYVRCPETNTFFVQDGVFIGGGSDTETENETEEENEA